MSKKKICVGIAGLGGIGNYHAMAICANPDCELVALFDAKREALDKAAAAYPQAKAYSTFSEFLDAPGLDAVVVGTSNDAHAAYSIAAVRHGLHVLCEKPIAMNAAEAKKMVSAVRGKRVIGMVNFNYRAIPSFQAAREVIRSGKLGKILRVRAEYLQSWVRDPKGPLTWRNRKEFAGFGALGDLGSHMIDIVCHTLGVKPKCAVGLHAINLATKIDPATKKKAKMTTDTDAQFMIDFGPFASMFETSQVETGAFNGLVMQVSGEKGTVRVTSNDRHNYEIALDASRTNTAGIPLTKTEVPKELQVEKTFNADFFLAIRKKTREYPTFEDGLLVQRAVDAVDRSMRSGKWESV